MHGLQAPRRADALSRGRIYVPLLATAAAVLVLDQATKELALRELADRPVELIDGVLSLRLTFNPGGAFGLLPGLPGFFLIATVVVIATVLLWARGLEDGRWAIPLGLILGGGLGNLYDRLFREFDGRVVDFVDLAFWPVFNGADAAITVGVLLVLIFGVRRER
ncbi:MAG: signal peptidase II [Actinomycetota bacterium]